jgi:hypothetical protein
MPVKDIGDERRKDGTNFLVCGMCIPPIKGRSTTLSVTVRAPVVRR